MDSIILEVIKKSSIKEIKALCKTSKNIAQLCKTYEKQIKKAQFNNLQQHIKESDNKIRDFASKNRFAFDEASKKEAIKMGMAIHYDKVWIDLMYLLSTKQYDEAEILLSCSKLPWGPYGFLGTKFIQEMPPKLMELLMSRFPESPLELFGYDNKRDLIEDFKHNLFQNKTFKKIIMSRL